ncbi:hypothetical protein V8B97DRAFT_1963573 [Scleroderma yunnanense]
MVKGPVTRQTSSDMNLLILLFAILYLLYTVLPRLRHKRVHNSAPALRSLLKPGNVSLAYLLEARAIPNQRLIRAFGITSTFVSGDPEVHHIFVNRAKDILGGLSTKGQGWRALLQATEDAVSRLLPAKEMDYDTFMQCMTFTIILVALLNVDPESLHSDDLVFVTSTINRRWTDSKKVKTTALTQDGSLNKVQHHLERWISDHDRYPNPLNFILPAYETMWRVVAVTVAHLYCHGDDSMRNIVLRFADCPTEEQFRSFGEENMEPSMKNIITEALRLHPPTKRIVRAALVPWWKKMFVPSLEVADVEAVHLSSTYGDGPTYFDPMRFHPSRVSEQPELFAFGYGRLSCPAASWAPMAGTDSWSTSWG